MIISLVWLVFYYVQRFRYLQTKDKQSVSQLVSLPSTAQTSAPLIRWACHITAAHSAVKEILIVRAQRSGTIVKLVNSGDLKSVSLKVDWLTVHGLAVLPDWTILFIFSRMFFLLFSFHLQQRRLCNVAKRIIAKIPTKSIKSDDKVSLRLD